MKPLDVTLLGSTGSIGDSTLRVMEEAPDRFRIVALAAGSNSKKVLEQIKAFEPAVVAMADGEAANAVRASIGVGGPEILDGDEGIHEIAGRRCSRLINAVVGAAGLSPTMTAMGRAERICLANKETLVAAGELVMEKAESTGTEIIPIDSEHSAIHQCLAGRMASEVDKIVLTASGGPFREWSAERIAAATPSDALTHPTWKMGPKITIDSATLMNKGLEVIEAMHLFAVGPDKIDVIVHPQSVIHSMIEFSDGSFLAQLGETDMRHPIRYALTYPERLLTNEKFKLTESPALTFESPDMDRFPCLSLAFRAARAGGTAPTVLNAANEVAVAAFLEGKIALPEIPAIIDRALKQIHPGGKPSLEELLSADRSARIDAHDEIAGRVMESGR